jgi:hypothetical protein
VYDRLRAAWGGVLRELARQKGRRSEGGPVRAAHGPMVLAIPPQSAVAQVVGDLKGKGAIDLGRTYGGEGRTSVGEPCWARG